MKKILSLIILPVVLLFSFTAYAQKADSSGEHATSSRASQTSQQTVDINSATVAQLESLKGLGPKKAQAIVAYRKQNGRFKSVSDLANVSGIGQSLTSRLQKENPGRLVAKQST